ncbi:MAG: peptidoglycan DD-metalloendopeptidase family protein [Candidatus Gracilibacteria bacterium]
MFKKSYLLLILLLFPLTLVNALSKAQKGAILNNFKEQQYDLLFESDLSDFSSEYSDIFDISKKVNIYENISEKVEEDRHEFEGKNNAMLEQITSLEESIIQLDLDINNAMINVDKINNSVIQTKNDIEGNKKIIEFKRKLISDNMEILLEYLIYIYKKGNTVYEDAEIDNLKSILLNEENISDIINDLYFKGIIQITGKKLIDNHRKYISELYLRKVQLEKQEINLKKLRKMGIIEKKVLDDKKAFKERILEVSKGQQSYYQKYVYDKLEIEKTLQLKAFAEKVKFNNIRNDILEKYGCTFIDVSKNTAEVRALSGKCLDINKMIYSESMLEGIKEEDGFNFFDWPIEPNMGISSYYHDSEYKRDFGSEHEAIDIVSNQGTLIKAPADGYVIFIEEPDSQDYAYVALKHYNGYMTIYGHVSDISVDEFDYVKSGEVFAQTGGEFGTLGAGFLTTGPHLHFEVFKDEEYINPFSVLNLSYLEYAKIPETYKFKYYTDFKERKGYEFANKTQNSRIFTLNGSNEIERQKDLISKYAVPVFRNWQMWIDESLDGNIDPSFVMCIGLAETTLGKHLKTPYNIGNVGNTDSGATVVFPNAASGVYWMIKTLNNKYLGNYDEIRQLSRYGNKDSSKPIYASSPDNWHNNIIKCMSHLKGTYVPDDYNFRLIN